MSRLFLGFLKVFAKKLSPRRDAAEMTLTGKFIGRREKLFSIKTSFAEKILLPVFCSRPVRRIGGPAGKGIFERFFLARHGHSQSRICPKKVR
jgi:hypothetical protein